MVEVTGANRPSFNGCYREDEHLLAYNGPANMRIIFKRQNGVGYWRIGYKDAGEFPGRLIYTKTSSYGAPQGEYVSSDDGSIATVKCKSVCPSLSQDKKLSNAKSMKKKGKLHFEILKNNIIIAKSRN